MAINRENLGAHELIGLKTVVKTSSDPTLVGIAGMIRDETRNTLVVETDGKFKTIPKANTGLVVEFASGDQSLLHGTQLSFRPEDRVKRGLGRRR